MKIVRFLTFLIVTTITSCGKDNGNCPTNITNKIQQDIHFNKLSSCGNEPNGAFTRYYNSWDKYKNDPTCNRRSIPRDLNFNGIVLAQGVKVPYVGPQGGDPGYELDVKVKVDTCERFVDFKFILTIIDTSRVLEHNENVLVLLNDIDSTYTVNFSHEIIPYSE